MGEAKKLFGLWRRMLNSKKYIVILIVSGFIFYMLNGLILNIPNIKSFYSALGLFPTIKILFFNSFNFTSQITLFGAIGTILLSFLVGMLISLLSYRYSMSLRGGGKSSVLGTIGLFLGVAAPGCAACGIGLVGILGLSSALAVLPFKGHEIIVLAVVIVAFSIIGVSKKFYKVCDISKNMNNKNLKGGSENERRRK